MRLIVLLIISIFLTAQTSVAATPSVIRITGSSTLYPFITVIAEEYADNTKFRAPIIEATGTGGGFNLFCSPNEQDRPTVTNASRQIKDSELKRCNASNIKDLLEVNLGYDGIILASNVNAIYTNIDSKTLFLALADQIPQNGKLIANPHKYWDEIDAKLPHKLIEVYGPSMTSGTRDVFDEKIMLATCKDLPEFMKSYPETKQLNRQCLKIRSDGPFIQVGENDNLIIQKLLQNNDALGIFGYNFLQESTRYVKAVNVNKIAPTVENISSGKYILARPLYIYFNMPSFCKINGSYEFINELTSDAALSSEGYLISKGLISLPKKDLENTRKKVHIATSNFKCN